MQGGKIINSLLLTGAAVVLLHGSAPGARSAVHVSDLESIVEVETNLGTVACAWIDTAWVAGSLGRSGTTFSSLSEQIKKQNQALKKATGAKYLKIKKKIAALKKLKKAGQAECNLLEEYNGGEPTPTPTVAPSATPTPTPRPSCYDSQRRTSCFGIPTGILGRESVGQSLFNSFCSGCHDGSADGGRRNRSYTEYLNSFSEIPEMQPYQSDYSSQDIADLTAYLNRFNPNQ